MTSCTITENVSISPQDSAQPRFQVRWNYLAPEAPSNSTWISSLNILQPLILEQYFGFPKGNSCGFPISAIQRKSRTRFHEHLPPSTRAGAISPGLHRDLATTLDLSSFLQADNCYQRPAAAQRMVQHLLITPHRQGISITMSASPLT